jgi:TIR domain/NACHT domain
VPFGVPDGGWDCFVAHADVDSPVAERLADLLRAREPALRVFEDSMLPAGLPWNVLDQQLEASAIIVVLATEHSAGAHFLDDEIATAIKLFRRAPNRHRIVPVYIGRRNELQKLYGLKNLKSVFINDPDSLGEAADQVLSSLRDLRGAPAGDDQPTRLSEQEYRRVSLRYAEQMFLEWRHIDLGSLGSDQDQDGSRTPGPHQLLPLDELYISLHADPRSPADRERAHELFMQDYEDLDVDRDIGDLERRARSGLTVEEIIEEKVSRGRALGDDEPYAGPAGGSGADDAAGVPLVEAFRRHRVLILRGGPGSGKSVLCQWLGGQLTAAVRDGTSGELGQPRVPMWFRLADYADYYAGELDLGQQPGSITRFLADTLTAGTTKRRVPGCSAEQLELMLTQALETGEAVMLIDGLDEVTAHRELLSEAIVRFVFDYIPSAPDAGAEATQSRAHLSPAGNQVVITSRIAGYEAVSVPLSQAVHYVIRPMTEDQITQFATNFFQSAYDSTSRVRLLLDRLFEGDNPALAKLARIPLLLASICLLWYRDEKLPESRAAIYRKLIVDMAARWRELSAGKPPVELNTLLGHDDQILGMLADIAVVIHEEYPSGGLPEGKLLTTVEHTLLGRPPYSKVDPRAFSAALLEVINAKVSVLAQIGTRTYGFSHLTFQEYLAGLTLVSASITAAPQAPAAEAIAQLAGKMAGRLGDSRWREPLLLALGGLSSSTRAALMRYVLDGDDLDLDIWADVCLAAILEGSPEAVADEELSMLARLLVTAYGKARELTEGRADLELGLADLRRQFGSDRFDPAALSLLERRPDLAPVVAYVYWRRRWLTGEALGVFAANAQLDSLAWGWPMRRALQHAVAPADSPEVPILDQLSQPSDDQQARLYELGYPVWELERQRRREESTGEVAPGALPVRDFFMSNPARWDLCTSSPSCAAAIVVLAGGLDYRDIMRWDTQYSDLADLLRLGETTLANVMQDTAAQLVPRFGTGEVTYSIALYLNEPENKLPLSQAAPPRLDSRLLARPVGPHLAAALLDWADGPAAGDPTALRRALTAVVASDAGEHEKADARLALVFLSDARSDPRPLPAPARTDAREWAGDAALRGHRSWFPAIWQPDNGLTWAERAAMHRWLLRRLFTMAGRPVHIEPAPRALSEATADAPAAMLVADSLGRIIRELNADARGGALELEYPPGDVPPHVVRDALAMMPCLPHWPGHRRNFPLGDSDVPRGPSARPAGLLGAGLVETARQLIAYVAHKEPEWCDPLAAYLFGALLPFDLQTPVGLEGFILAVEMGAIDPADPAVLVDNGVADFDIPPGFQAPWRGNFEHPRFVAAMALGHYLPGPSRQPDEAALRALADAERSPRRRLSAYHFLASNDLMRTDDRLLSQIAECAEAEPAESVRAAFTLSALTRHAAAPDVGERWQLRALDLLQAEHEDHVLAEALFRLRYLGPRPDQISRRQHHLADRIRSPFLHADAVGDDSAALHEILRIADAVPMAARVSFTVTSTLLGDSGPADETGEPDRAGLRYDWLGGDDFSGAGASTGDTRPLELATVIEFETEVKAHGSTTPAIDEALAAADSVDVRALPRLERLLASSPPESSWVPAIRRLVALQHMATGSRDLRDYLDLADLAVTADARTACTAILHLLGPYRAVERKHRHYQLSRHGAGLWWELGRAAASADREPPRRGRLLVSALDEWDIDHAEALTSLTDRPADDQTSQRVWPLLIGACGLWREESQDVLVRWLAASNPSAEIIDASLSLVAMHANLDHPLTPALIETVTRLAGGQVPPTMVCGGDGFTNGRLDITRVVSAACREALEQGIEEPQVTLADARARFLAAAEPVMLPGAANDISRLKDYGALHFTPLGSGPEDVQGMVDEAVNSDSGAALLADWLRALDHEDLTTRQRRLPVLELAEAEAVLSALVVISLRHPLTILTRCKPEVFQPILSHTALYFESSIGRQAAMILLGRLRFVDLEPAAGPALTAVIESALTDASPGVQEAALTFTRQIRHVRGGSLAGSLLDLARTCPNETAAWGYARLADVRSQAARSSGRDRRAVRALLREGLNAPAHRRLAFLVGNGSDEDPIRVMLQGHLETEFQRLALRSYSRHA